MHGSSTFFILGSCTAIFNLFIYNEIIVIVIIDVNWNPELSVNDQNFCNSFEKHSVCENGGWTNKGRSNLQRHQ